jgi:hypothetical protein
MALDQSIVFAIHHPTCAMIIPMWSLQVAIG